MLSSKLFIRQWNNLCIISRHYKMTGEIETVIDDIKTSSLDKRLYKGIVLQNGLKALVISDSTTDKSAAALDVHVGSMSDPSNIPGLAHFCEHMLFLGTSKYPKEDEYQKYISQHAGSCNAYTSSEHTNYYFDIGHEHLQGALDRFSQFFLSPMFDQSCTDREINAVNSEHLKNIMADSRRLHHIDQVTSDPDHPFSKFSTGNLETLSVTPKKLSIDVRNELIKFHEKYYSSNIMTLAIIGRESLETLTDWVKTMFGDVKNKNVIVPTYPKSPYRSIDLEKKCYVTPIKDLRNLLLTFPMHDLSALYESAPGHYLGHLIGHEGMGSLLSLLKSKGWVNSLVAGPKGGARGFNFFIIQVDLTEDGQEHINDIMICMFSYIKLLKDTGTQSWIQDELKQLLEIDFMFKDKEKPSSYVSNITGKLHKYPLCNVLSANQILTDYLPNEIEKILDCLNCNSMKVTIISKKFEEKTIECEKWYGAKYCIEDIEPELLKNLKVISLNPELKFPNKNDFIASNLDQKSPPLVPTRVPKLLQDSEFSKVWFKQDDTFKLPKQTMAFELYSPSASISPRNYNMNFLITELLRDSLNEYSYDAELAGLNYTIVNTMYGLFLRIDGYNDKQLILLEKVLQKLTKFDIDSKRFEILKDVYTRSLDNFQTEQPYQHAVYFAQVVRTEKLFTKVELRSCIDDVTLEEVQNFLTVLLKSIKIESIFHGNILEQEALKVTEIVEETFKKNTNTLPLMASKVIKFRDVQLPLKSSYVYQFQNTVQNTNAIQVILQVGGKNIEENITLEFLQQVISEPFFNILRTKEQLGYITHSGVLHSNGVLCLRFIIQSQKSPCYLDARIEAFIDHIKTLLGEMSEEEFNRHKTALASKRLEKPKKMISESMKHWSEISSGQYMFERDIIETNHLQKVSKEELLKFYLTYIHFEGDKRAKLSVHVHGKDDTVPESVKLNIEDHNKNIDATFLKCPQVQQSEILSDYNVLRNSLPFYNRGKPYIDVQLK